jgi:hypothetical protein
VRGGRQAAILVLAVATVLLAAVSILGWFYRHVILANLFGPPETTLTEAYEDRSAGPDFDHSAFDALLARYVDVDGWVDYEALQADVAALAGYVESVGQAPLEQLGRDARLALLLNAYNAFTLKLILEHYPISGIRDIPSAQRWDAVRWKVGGQTWSLNQIEHEQIRPKFREPRIHFVLVCAAVGCPPLRSEAFTAERLEAQLQEQAEYVHRHPTWFHFDPEANVVRLSQLYLWYEGDFEQVGGGVLKFAARFSPELEKAAASHMTPRIAWIEYDWSLNSKQNRKPR